MSLRENQMPKLATIFLLFIASLQTNAATAASSTQPTYTFSSGETQVTLLELYTIWFESGNMDIIKELDEALYDLLTEVMQEELEEG